MNSNVQSNGVWISISQNGQPVNNVTVNHHYTTDKDGRVFIYKAMPQDKYISLLIETPNGEKMTKSYLLKD